jgi:hypothetical protein
MMYMGRQAVKVHVDGSTFRVMSSRESSIGRTAAMTNLEPYYPDGRCINVYETGICLARKARQTARRTASCAHYEVTYSPTARRLTMDERIMWALCADDPYPSLQEAQESAAYSVAISPDLILERTSREPIRNVYWHSERVGTLTDTVFVPEYEGSCFTKLARQSMQELGLECL